MLESVGQRMDEVQQIYLFGGVLHVLAPDAMRAQPNVVLQRPGKQIRVLQDHPELAPQLLRIELADVAAADTDSAFLQVVEAQQQADEGGLARAGVAYDSDGFSGLDGRSEECCV